MEGTKKEKKAEEAPNSVILPPMPTTKSSSPNADEVRTNNETQATGATANTKNQAAVIKNVKRKDPNRAQYWDPNTVFAPKALRHYTWLKQQCTALRRPGGSY
ncbi:hypothetical protein FPOA_05867 [Fusarium poae]|uniref:Uncharacterized protein n=1 Tax=Fusarium poae TaxID=36050 RepID=A0A1B8AY33_FUSPO|nr:hypothetical protein FPOA_05867 [Fusarium poae]